jgi:hypothetical protein
MFRSALRVSSTTCLGTEKGPSSDRAMAGESGNSGNYSEPPLDPSVNDKTGRA